MKQNKTAHSSLLQKWTNKNAIQKAKASKAMGSDKNEHLDPADINSLSRTANSQTYGNIQDYPVLLMKQGKDST